MALQELTNQVHRLKIVLEDTQPAVWRRVEVPAVTRLGDLHTLLQAVMGWEDAHLHVFEFAGRRYSENAGLGLGPPDRDEHAARVGDVLRRKGAKGTYLYDFGDHWSHGITVEEIGGAEPGAVYPRLLDGRGSCPPEDCGGVPGFEYLRHLRDHPGEITGGYHGDTEEQRGWVELLESDDLDLEEARRKLREALGTLSVVEEPAHAAEGLAPARPVELPADEEQDRAAHAFQTRPFQERDHDGGGLRVQRGRHEVDAVGALERRVVELGDVPVELHGLGAGGRRRSSWSWTGAEVTSGVAATPGHWYENAGGPGGLLRSQAVRLCEEIAAQVQGATGSWHRTAQEDPHAWLLPVSVTEDVEVLAGNARDSSGGLSAGPKAEGSMPAGVCARWRGRGFQGCYDDHENPGSVPPVAPGPAYTAHMPPR